MTRRPPDPAAVDAMLERLERDFERGHHDPFDSGRHRPKTDVARRLAAMVADGASPPCCQALADGIRAARGEMAPDDGLR